MLYEALLIVARNLLALKSYVSTYGLVAGAQLYAKIGADGLPNGIISWLELDLSDGDTALDDMIGAAVKDASDGDLAYDDALYYYNPSKVDLSKTTLAGEIIYQDASDGDTYLDDAVRFIAADLADGDSSLDDVFAGATKGGSKLPLKMNLQFFAKNDGRNSAGLVTGGENLSDVKRMMQGSQGNAGVVPKEIADKMRGKQFSSFDAFREDFWKTVADSSYASEFSTYNIEE